MNKYWKVIFDGEEEDEVFETEEDAYEYGVYLSGCARTGAEILHMSNPGDNEYDESDFEEDDFEVIEVTE